MTHPSRKDAPELATADSSRDHAKVRPESAVHGRRPLSAVLVLVTTIAMAACTDQPADEGEFVADTAAAVGADTAEGFIETPGNEVDTVEVELVAFEIEMPERLEAGTKVFKVTNVGEVEHAFEIEGQGSEWVIEDVNPDETKHLTAELNAGSYVVYCPVSDHRQEGMELTLSVVPVGTEAD